MPLAQIIRGQLTKDSTNSIAWYIRLNPDMTFWWRIGVLKNTCLNSVNASLPPGVRKSKDLTVFFNLDKFLNFFPNIINFNLTIINFNAIKLAFIQLASLASSSAMTNPNSAFIGLCLRLIIPWSLQYRGKWCTYWTKSLDKSSIKVRKSKENLDVWYWLELRPLLKSLNTFVLYADVFQGYHIAKEPNLFLIKSTILQVGIKRELPELLQNLLYGSNVSISIIISLDEDVIQIYNDKDIKLLSKDLVDIFLKACWYVR